LVSSVEGRLDFSGKEIGSRKDFLAFLGIFEEKSLKLSVFKNLTEKYFDSWIENGNPVNLFVPLLRILARRDDIFRKKAKEMILEIIRNSGISLGDMSTASLESLLIGLSLDIRGEQKTLAGHNSFPRTFFIQGRQVFKAIYQKLEEQDQQAFLLSLIEKTGDKYWSVDGKMRNKKKTHGLVLDLSWRSREVYDSRRNLFTGFDPQNNIINFKIYPENKYVQESGMQSLVNAFASVFVGWEPGYVSQARGWQVEEGSRKQIEQKAEELLSQLIS